MGFETSKPAESSLQAVLAKLVERMASVEQKVSKVNKLESSVKMLTMLVTALMDKPHAFWHRNLKWRISLTVCFFLAFAA